MVMMTLTKFCDASGFEKRAEERKRQEFLMGGDDALRSYNYGGRCAPNLLLITRYGINVNKKAADILPA